jgi:hypothetical protein
VAEEAGVRTRLRTNPREEDRLMKKCPYCAEEIQDEAVKCKHCGQALVSNEWRQFCDRYRSMRPKQRTRAWEGLSADQRKAFDAAWSALGYDTQQTPQATAETGVQAVPARGGGGRTGKPLLTPKRVLVGVGLLVLLVVIGVAGAQIQLASSYRSGKAALEAGDYEKAERLLSQVNARSPNYRDVKQLLSQPEVAKLVKQRQAAKDEEIRLRVQKQREVEAGERRRMIEERHKAEGRERDRLAAAPHLNARELVMAYDQNEVAADRSYKGKTIVVEGSVDRVGKDILDTMYVSLSGPENSFRSVQCLFEDEHEAQLSNLHPGQRVQVVGRCDGLMMNVLVKDCQIVP